jgi:hypothetical protein
MYIRQMLTSHHGGSAQSQVTSRWDLWSVKWYFNRFSHESLVTHCSSLHCYFTLIIISQDVQSANYSIASSVLNLLASVFGVWLGDRLDVQRNMVQFPVWANDIALLQSDQTGHGAHSHLKPRSIMSGAICYLPHAIMGMHMDNLVYTK